MVQDQRAVAAADKGVDAGGWVALGRQEGGLEDGGDVVVALVSAGLARGKMAVDEAERRVVDHEADDDGALVAVQSAHAALDFGAAEVGDALAEVGFDKDAREEAD